MGDIAITGAKLIPMEGDRPVADEAQHIEVQFNPATLRVALSNSLKADSRGGSRNPTSLIADALTST